MESFVRDNPVEGPEQERVRRRGEPPGRGEAVLHAQEAVAARSEPSDGAADLGGGRGVRGLVLRRLLRGVVWRLLRPSGA